MQTLDRSVFNIGSWIVLVAFVLSQSGIKLCLGDTSLEFFKLKFNNNNYLLFVILEFGGSLNVRAITDFIDGGGNVLVATSSSIGKYQE